MIIDVSKTREEYFTDLPVRDLLLQYIEKEEGKPITINDVRNLEAGSLVVGTREGDIEGILAKEYTSDSLDLVRKLRQLGSNQLLVLPPDYRITSPEVRRVLVYEEKTLVKLDAKHIQEALLQHNKPSRSLSRKRKVQEKWDPERVLSAAFNHLHQHKDQFAERTLSCYSWWGSDRHRRVVSLYRAVQGTELAFFTRLAEVRLTPNRIRKQLVGTNPKTGNKYTQEEIKEAMKEIAHWEKVISKWSLDRLAVSGLDCIQEDTRGFRYDTARHFYVPSRQKRTTKSHRLELLDIPILNDEKMDLAYGLIWELAGSCGCEDKRYSANRRKRSPYQGQREDFFCSHEQAAYHHLRSQYVNDMENDKLVTFSPFTIPTQTMMEDIEKLRRQTILLEKKTNRWSKRSLNHTEIENIIWKIVTDRGYEACFSTEPSLLESRGSRPSNYLVKLTNK